MTLRVMTFSYRGVQYALPAASIIEVIQAPMLSNIEGAPSHEIGVFDLRGEVVNVIDLSLRFAHNSAPIQVGHYIAVVKTVSGLAGVLLDQLGDYTETDLLRSDSSAEHEKAFDPLVHGFIELNAEMIMLLDVDELLNREPDTSALMSPGSIEIGHLSESDIQVMRERTAHYRQLPIETTQQELEEFAQVRMGDDLYGFSLESVIEFAPLTELYPLPFTSQQVLGCMNLRGEVVVVVDLLPSLNREPLKPSGNQFVIVCTIKGGQIGILVDEVQLIVSIERSALHRVPASVSSEQTKFYIGEAHLDDVEALVIHTQALINSPEVMTKVFNGLSV